MSSLSITLFGPPRAECAGIVLRFHRHQTLAPLAYLAAADRPHSRDALATLLWPEQAAQPAHGALRRILYDLGCTIGKDWLRFENGQVTLPAQPGLHVDVRHFCALQARVTAHGHTPHHVCDDCLATLTEVATLYQDDFLAGFTLTGSAEFDAWQTLTTENLRLALAAALEKLASTLLTRHHYDQALSHARRWLTLDPLHEPSHRLLMRLYAAAGDRAALIRQYEQYSQVLAAELGITPLLETNVLYHELVSGPWPAHAERAAVPWEVVDAAAHRTPASPTP